MVDIDIDRMLLPLATKRDAKGSCAALAPYLTTPESTIVVLHIIEKHGDFIDKAPLAAQEERAEEIFRVVKEEFVDEDVIIETDLRYATSVLEEILSAATDHQVDAIVFRPRDTNRLAKLLSGDLALKLLMNSPYPIFVLPSPDAASLE